MSKTRVDIDNDLLPDPITAAAAEAARMTVLHYDAVFDTIAAVTGQDAKWVVARGAL